VQQGQIASRPCRRRRRATNPQCVRAQAVRARHPDAAGAGEQTGDCTTSAYVPQVQRAWRTKSTKDISLQAFAQLVTGLSLWLIYGIWRGEISLIAANSVTLTLASTILHFKVRHG
jgi:MtN3 and saliva related transmembrane protein